MLTVAELLFLALFVPIAATVAHRLLTGGGRS